MSQSDQIDLTGSDDEAVAPPPARDEVTGGSAAAAAGQGPSPFSPAPVGGATRAAPMSQIDLTQSDDDEAAPAPPARDEVAASLQRVRAEQ